MLKNLATFATTCTEQVHEALGEQESYRLLIETIVKLEQKLMAACSEDAKQIYAKLAELQNFKEAIVETHCFLAGLTMGIQLWQEREKPTIDVEEIAEVCREALAS
ncbi:MAG: hypothetical protein ACPL5F_02410 [Moorellaceae bacterium]